jgi:hypothetical protein
MAAAVKAACVVRVERPMMFNAKTYYTATNDYKVFCVSKKHSCWTYLRVGEGIGDGGHVLGHAEPDAAQHERGRGRGTQCVRLHVAGEHVDARDVAHRQPAADDRHVRHHDPSDQAPVQVRRRERFLHRNLRTDHGGRQRLERVVAGAGLQRRDDRCAAAAAHGPRPGHERRR